MIISLNMVSWCADVRLNSPNQEINSLQNEGSFLVLNLCFASLEVGTLLKSIVQFGAHFLGEFNFFTVRKLHEIVAETQLYRSRQEKWKTYDRSAFNMQLIWS